MTIELLSKSPADTFKIGEKIGKELKGNEIILLNGDLGTGKTLLTKGIARSLNIDPDEVVSPSFTLVNEYRNKKGLRLIHADLYRLGDSIIGNLPEIDDYVGDAIIVIEWAQYINPTYFDLDNTIDITFHLLDENENHRLLNIHQGAL